MQGSRRLGKEAEHRPVDHRPAASPAPLARRPRLAARPDAQRGGVGPHRRQLHQRLLQHGDVLAEPGDLVHRAVSRRARRRAHPDRGRPAPGPPPRTRGVADDGRGAPQRRGSAPPGAHPVRQERAADRLEPRLREPSSTRRPRTSPGCSSAPGTRWPTRASGTSPTRAARRPGLDCSAAGPLPTRAGSSTTTDFATGRPPTRARTRRRRTSAAATPARARAGTRSTSGRSNAGWGASPAGAVLPRRLAGQPPRRARLPGVVQRRRLRAGGLLRPGRRAAADRLTRTCAASPRVHSLMRMGMTAYLGPLGNRRAQLDYVNFYAYLHRVIDAKIGRLLEGARRSGRSGLPALAHHDRPLLRSRRDGAFARRPAPEGVQRVRGDDQHPDRRLEPGPVPGPGARRRRSPRWSTCCRRSPRSPAPMPPARDCAVAT